MNKFDDMNPNLLILFQKVIFNPELAKKFSNCRTLDEFYSFCSEIIDGYTKNELHRFLLNLASLTLDDKNDKILLNNDLEKVYGGTRMNIISNRYMSAFMGILSLANVTSATNFNVHAVSNNVITKKIDRKDTDESLLERLVEDVAVAASVGAVAGAAVYYFLKASEESYGDGGGLQNVGNSCYMNALVQQLHGIKAFRDKVMCDRSDDKKVKALRNIFSGLNNNSKMRLSDISGSIRDLGHRGRQEDATELLSYRFSELLGKYDLVRMFSEPLKINEVPEGTPLVEILKHGGDPDLERRREYLRRELPSSIEFSDEELNHLFSVILKEKLDEKSEGGKPSEKDKVEDAVKKLSKKSQKKIKSMKLDSAVLMSFNKPVEINPVNGQFGVIVNRTKAGGKEIKRISVPMQMEKDGANYDLTGAMVHSGWGKDSGHYYSYKKNLKGEWICYNDSSVSTVPEEKVRNDIEINGTLLIYTIHK